MTDAITFSRPYAEAAYKVAVNDNTARASRSFMRSRAPHVLDLKNPHAILAAKPPILGGLLVSFE